MNNGVAVDKLKESLRLCSMHNQPMQYAYGKVKQYFPLDEKTYHNLSQDDLSYIDQLIFRFSKLQDSMGTRLFPALLICLGEDIEAKPFIDLLTLLEKLELIEDHQVWLEIRETRNIVTHEYPFIESEIIEGLNLLNKKASLLTDIWNKLDKYAHERFEL